MFTKSLLTLSLNSRSCFWTALRCGWVHTLVPFQGSHKICIQTEALNEEVSVVRLCKTFFDRAEDVAQFESTCLECRRAWVCWPGTGCGGTLL